MSRCARLAAALLAVLLPGLFLVNWLLVSARDTAIVGSPVLPLEVGPWLAGSDQELESEVLAVIEPDAYVVRSYGAVGRAPVWVYVGLYAGRAGYGRGAHDPEVCYPAQGWEILRSDPVRVPLADAGVLAARLLAVQQGDRHESVLYWFQPADRWPRSSAFEQLQRIFDAVRGRTQYAFVRLSAAPEGPSQAVEPDLVAFAAAIAPAIRHEVDRLR